MRPLVRAASTATQRVVAEPAGLTFVAFFHLMVTAILSGVWKVAVEVNGGVLVGYTATALVWYIATSEAATMALPQRLIEEIGDDIGSGRFDVELLRPISPLALRLTTEMGKALPRLGVCITCGMTFAWIFGGSPLRLASLALALPSLLLAVAINLCVQHAFAAGSFWILDARGLWFLYSKFVFILGGMLLPLEVLPDRLATVAKLLPFSAMAYAPARLASGHFEPGLILIQVGWPTFAGFAAQRAFRSGERHLVRVAA